MASSLQVILTEAKVLDSSDRKSFQLLPRSTLNHDRRRGRPKLWQMESADNNFFSFWVREIEWKTALPPNFPESIGDNPRGNIVSSFALQTTRGQATEQAHPGRGRRERRLGWWEGERRGNERGGRGGPDVARREPSRRKLRRFFKTHAPNVLLLNVVLCCFQCPPLHMPQSGESVQTAFVRRRVSSCCYDRKAHVAIFQPPRTPHGGYTVKCDTQGQTRLTYYSIRFCDTLFWSLPMPSSVSIPRC